MFRLHVLGSLDLRGPDGEEILSVLAQPKRTAILTYLAVASPKGFHRRDQIAGLFWPESDQDHARASLRVAVHFLRRSLGDDVIQSRGNEDIGLDWSRFSCDAVGFEEALQAGDLERALELYRGDLLEGFFLSGCPEFERWLATERERLRERAADAAWALAGEQMERGAVTEAERTGQRALRLVPTDESAARAFIETLARAGDRAAALRFAERLSAVLAEELEVEPSAETEAVVEAIREGRIEGSPRAASPKVRAEPSVRAPEDPADGGPTVPRVGAREGVAVRGRFVLAGVLAIVALVLLRPRSQVGPGDPMDGPESRNLGASAVTPSRVAVLPLENRTGDAEHDDLGLMVADYVGQAVQRLDGVDLVPVSYTMRALEAQADGDTRAVVRALAEQMGSGVVVVGRIHATADSLEFRLELIDVVGSSAIGSIEERAPLRSATQAITALCQRVTGALANELDPYFRTWHGRLLHPPKLEAYREMRRGHEAFDRSDLEASFRHHQAAYALDTTLVQAVVSAIFVAGSRAEADSLASFADERRHMLSRQGQLDLDIALGVVAGDSRAQLRASREAATLTPFGYAEVMRAVFELRANLPGNALEALARYDPFPEWRRAEAPHYWSLLTRVHHELGNYEVELAQARRAREIYPTSPWLLAREVRALAALGRVEEVNVLLRQARALTPDPTEVYTVAGTELRAHGHAEAARGVFDRSVQWLAVRSSEEPLELDHKRGLALALYKAERWDQAGRVARELVSQAPHDLLALALIGRVAARTGDTASALATTRQIADLPDPEWHRGWLRFPGRQLYHRAQIAALLNRPEDAMRLLREWSFWGAFSGEHLHREMDFESLRDRDDYREFIRPKG